MQNVDKDTKKGKNCADRFSLFYQKLTRNK